MSQPSQIVDIGVLTIRDDEFRALLDVFPQDAGTKKTQRREYALRRAEAGDGALYTLALARQVEQGNGEAQEAARDLIDDLEPSLLVVVGIAAGLPSDDVTLGDVILSTRIHDFSVEARKTRSKPTYSLTGGPIERNLSAAIANLAARELELGDWTRDLPVRPPVRWQGSGQLYGPRKWQDELREKLEAHYGKRAVPRAPVFMAGPIASSDRLVKDPSVLMPWRESSRHLLAVEMESAGVYRAARERCPMLAIRGISDIVGLKRHNAWTQYACKSAAAFTRAFLRTGPVPVREAGERLSTLRERLSSEPEPSTETVFANLARVLEFPNTIFVAPALCGTAKQGWARMLEGARGHVSRAWVLHEGNVYSFQDPSSGPLSKIADGSGAEEHQATDWAGSEDEDKRRLFVRLLNGALQDDLDGKGVRFTHRDDMFAFIATSKGPRVYRYKGLRQFSEVTVVSQYTTRGKDGREHPYLRHLAFKGRFRRLGEQWCLEILPTYRFTTDGWRSHPFHEEKLSGIKRLERNRSVLSQALVWGDVLKAPSKAAWLRFGSLVAFVAAAPPGTLAPTGPGEGSPADGSTNEDPS